MTKKSRGFTLIELIVVIAIIAILAAIVMVGVTEYINKAKDAAAIADLDNMIKNANLWLIDNTTISGFTNVSGYTAAKQALIKMGYLYTAPNLTGYMDSGGYTTIANFCACINKKSSSKSYCIDTTGAKKEYDVSGSTNFCGYSTYACEFSTGLCH